MADVLSEVRSSLEKRLRELEPLIKEHAQILEALDALKGAGARARRAATTGAEPRAAKNGTARRRRGRPRGTGSRAQEALRLVHTNPGITIADMAKRMKIHANYLYRVLPQLQKDGKIKKDGKGYHPAETDRGSAAG